MNSVPMGTALGINLAGAEFSTHRADYSNANPGVDGTDYFFPSRRPLSYYASHGMNLVRLPVAWERLQPELGGYLDDAYLERLTRFLDDAAAHGCHVVVDLHNYGRYRRQDDSSISELIVAADVSQTSSQIDSSYLVDLWLRLAARIRDYPAVYAYGLMNEPHDMLAANWHKTSSHVVTAIRDAGDENWIWVAGDGWSSAEKWGRYNPVVPWVTDPLRKVAYEAHVYFDEDGSGKYRMSFARELERDAFIEDRGVRRLQPFANWCKRNGVVGVVGEFGVPWGDSGWLPVLDRFLGEVRKRDMKACAWAGGGHWGGYVLSLDPRGGDDVAPLKLIARHAALISAGGDPRSPR